MKKETRTIELFMAADGKMTIRATFVEWIGDRRKEQQTVTVRNISQLHPWLLEWIATGKVPTEAQTAH